MLSLPECGVEIELTSCVDPFSKKNDDLLIVRLNLRLQYSHLFKCFPTEYIHWTPLINQCFHIVKLSMSTMIIIESSWVGSNALKSLSVKVMGGILRQVIAEAEFTDCTTQRCFFRAKLEHPPPAKPPTIVLITSLVPQHASSSILGVHSSGGIALVVSLHGFVWDTNPYTLHLSSRALLSDGRIVRTAVISLHKSVQVFSLDKFLNLILYCLTFLVRVPIIAMVPTFLVMLVSLGLETFRVWIQWGVVLKTRYFNLPTFVERRLTTFLFSISFFFFLLCLVSVWTWFHYTRSSSSCINFATRCRSSSISDANFLDKLSTKSPNCSVVTICCIATSRLIFYMFINIFVKPLHEHSKRFFLFLLYIHECNGG